MSLKPAPTPPEKVETARASLQARKQAFVREAIWAAAIDLFSDKGFEETTVEEIVAAAGTSRRTFFRHFESKRDLIAYPVVSYGASLRQAIESCPAEATPADLFRHVVRDVARRTVADERTRKVMEIAARYPAARGAQLSRIAEVQDSLAAAFARRCPSEITAHVLAGLTLHALSVVYRAWFLGGKKDIAPALDHVFAELEHCLAPVARGSSGGRRTSLK
jgi:AcrR family transcriptional regulator